MSSEVLIPQAALTDMDRCDPTATGDDVAISVRDVGKMYYLYNRPQDRLKQAFLWGRRKLYREFWALRDVSFEVRRGEALGIPSLTLHRVQGFGSGQALGAMGPVMLVPQFAERY
jgi:hypothetical protein